MERTELFKNKTRHSDPLVQRQPVQAPRVRTLAAALRRTCRYVREGAAATLVASFTHVRVPCRAPSLAAATSPPTLPLFIYRAARAMFSRALIRQAAILFSQSARTSARWADRRDGDRCRRRR